MLIKQNRLIKRKEFGYIHKHGKKVFSPYMTLVYIGTKLEQPRFGFVVSKKVGSAVVRNKIKRQLSEIVRLNLHVINKGYNYVFSVKPAMAGMPYEEIQKEVFKTLTREKLLLSVKQQDSQTVNQNTKQDIRQDAKQNISLNNKQKPVVNSNLENQQKSLLQTKDDALNVGEEANNDK